jgi:D-alanyl-D-alanine carboxypeptidase
METFSARVGIAALLLSSLSLGASGYGLYYLKTSPWSVESRELLELATARPETTVVPETASTTPDMMPAPEAAPAQEPAEVEPEAQSPKVFMLFTDLLSGMSFPNTVVPDERISLFGDQTADDVLYALAEDAGYIRQPVVSGELVSTEGKLVQPAVKERWEGLKALAASEGIRLSIVSAYRSPEAQRSLFLKYFKEETRRSGRSKDFTAAEIAQGAADAVILTTLGYAAPPGYSRHHTGYTLDIRDVDSGLSFVEFGKTRGFRWIAKNSYENARKFGFIPSYPKGERDGGAEPEPWEFVWVGPDALESLPDLTLR